MPITSTDILSRLSIHPTAGNAHNLPEHLSLWEIMLNQHYPTDYISEAIRFFTGSYEDFILDLIQNLIDQDRVCIMDPETWEIIYKMDR